MLFYIPIIFIFIFGYKKIIKNFYYIKNIKKSISKSQKSIEVDDIPINNKDYILKNLQLIIDRKYNIFNNYNLIIKKYTEYIDIYQLTKKSIQIIVKQEQIINTMIMDFNVAKKELKNLKKNNPIETDKYLLQFNNDLKYYLIHYIDNVKKIINELETTLKEHKYENINNIINKIETYKKAYYLEINSVYYVKELLNDAHNNIITYENDIKKQNGTLYNKLYNKIKKDIASDDTIYNWNIAKKEIAKYIKNKNKESDIVVNSNNLIHIITLLNKVDILSNADIEKNKL